MGFGSGYREKVRWEDEDHRGEEREGETNWREGWWYRSRSSYGGGGLGSCRGRWGVWLVSDEVEWEDKGETHRGLQGKW